MLGFLFCMKFDPKVDDIWLIFQYTNWIFLAYSPYINLIVTKYTGRFTQFLRVV